MLLLYLFSACGTANVDVIYIPLCFYFILQIRQILKRLRHIYIPLCFYFIKFCLTAESRQPRIYIPLCFYFIWSSSDENVTVDSFTFHYASTLSQKVRESRWENGKFTFHYASTLSEMEHAGLQKKMSFTFHYASTLSDISTYGHIELYIFTFHYASTLSCLSASGTTHQIYLHSTMLLLYLSWVTLYQ